MVWNSEAATQAAPAKREQHSAIDLSLSSVNVELNWTIADEEDATSSDHEVIVWEVLGGRLTSGEASSTTTGGDICGWDPKEKSGRGREAAEEERAAAQDYYLRSPTDPQT